MKYAIVIYSNDAETIWNGLRLANTSLGYDNQVTVFLLGKGVESVNIKSLKYDIQEQLAMLLGVVYQAYCLTFQSPEAGRHKIQFNAALGDRT